VLVPGAMWEPMARPPGGRVQESGGTNGPREVRLPNPAAAGAVYSSPENRAHADWRVIPSASPIRAQLAPSSRDPGKVFQDGIYDADLQPRGDVQDRGALRVDYPLAKHDAFVADIHSWPRYQPLDHGVRLPAERARGDSGSPDGHGPFTHPWFVRLQLTLVSRQLTTSVSN